jgi:hypothetical protein
MLAALRTQQLVKANSVIDLVAGRSRELVSKDELIGAHLGRHLGGPVLYHHTPSRSRWTASASVHRTADGQVTLKLGKVLTEVV